MGMSLAQFVAKHIRDVEGNGKHTSKFCLTPPEGGRNWDTFEGPWNTAETMSTQELVEEIENTLDALSEEWPKGRHQILLIALDDEGNERGTRICPVNGKLQKGGNAHLVGGMDAAVHAINMEIVNTVKSLLTTVNGQLAIQAKAIADTHSQNIELLELMRAEKIVRAEETAEQSDVFEKVLGMMQENAGPVLELMRAAQAQKAATSHNQPTTKKAPAINGKN